MRFWGLVSWPGRQDREKMAQSGRTLWLWMGPSGSRMPLWKRFCTKGTAPNRRIDVHTHLATATIEMVISFRIYSNVFIWLAVILLFRVFHWSNASIGSVWSEMHNNAGIFGRENEQKPKANFMHFCLMIFIITDNCYDFKRFFLYWIGSLFRFLRTYSSYFSFCLMVLFA